MLNRHIRTGPRADDAEKPFWISYADLMTSMMILFLVVMVGALLKITNVVHDAHILDEIRKGEAVRTAEIGYLCSKLKEKAKDVDSNVFVDCSQNRIQFGSVGQFAHDSFVLPSEGIDSLRRMVPLILEAAESPEGRKWLKQIQIEGFTDTDGTYLYNLHLSLQRSEYVMCSLLDDQLIAGRKPYPLDEINKQMVQRLFLAGGASFNHSKNSKSESRRVELRIVFFGLKDKHLEEERYEEREFPESHKRDFCRIHRR